jgi:2'-phosphotransferase
MLRQDPQHRFEFKEEEGQWPGSKELLVRHQGGHTIKVRCQLYLASFNSFPPFKGVQTSAKRIKSSSKIPAAIFCTDVERWKTFSAFLHPSFTDTILIGFVGEHGLWSERGDELIYLAPTIPEYEGAEGAFAISFEICIKAHELTASTSSARILISIDVEKAMRSGDIMFYKINDGSIITEGDQRGCIPPKYFKEVIAVTWDNEILLDRSNDSAT